jgi:protein phosphatase
MESIRLQEPCLVVLVGAAGSGKSTFAAQWFDDREILSSDRYRELVSGDAAEQSASDEAFRLLHRDLEGRLAKRGSAIVDATNVAPFARRALLERAHAAGVPAIAIVLDLPADVVLTRNAARADRVVPAAVRRQIGDLHRSLDGQGLPSEGFDEVYVIRTPGALDGLVLLRGSAPVSPPNPPR